MESHEEGMTGIQKEMENLLKVIGEAIPDEYEHDKDVDNSSEDQFSCDYGLDYDHSPLINSSSAMKDTKSITIPDLSIFGSGGQLLYQDIVDGDLTEHDELLTSIFNQAKSAARLHLIQIKQRLISERDSALQTNERHNLRLLRAKDDEIAALRQQLAATESVGNVWVHKYEILKEKIPPKVIRNQMYYLAEFSVLKIFRSWKQLIADQKKDGQCERFASLMRRRSSLSQTFARINRENARSRIEKLKEDHKVLVDRGTKEIVESYESEISRLRSDAANAHAAARHEQLRRKQLEEDLRRMLLKNMTAMNFEALSLFQHTTVPTPLEQQQSMGDLRDIISSTVDISCIERENRGSSTPGTMRDISRTVNTPFTSNTNISHRGNNDYDRPNRQMAYFEEDTPRKPLPMPPTLAPSRVPLGDSNILNLNQNVSSTRTPVSTSASGQGPVSGSGIESGMVRGFGPSVVTRPPYPPSVQCGDKGIPFTPYSR